jgi:hypothetical protein
VQQRPSDEIIERIAGGERTASQTKQEIAGAEWDVKRDSAAQRPQRNGAETQLAKTPGRN